ncbi:Uu.00g079350.m01.CDS01 [Anthostomella pinea]|uniref:Uu.00g079350.m01.CDS01 n=1 Tax=Anthostomella pinea TaxID=933095 RepID=A0AAI8YGT8_9PEZI|nr:Uu.00g079350.m01.CDS01 [Anthostomella pinea]
MAEKLHFQLRTRKLSDALPRTGLTFLGYSQVTNSPHRDADIANALRRAGYRLNKEGTTRAFLPMFQLAAPIINAGGAGDLWDVLEAVRTQIDWARGKRVSGSAFFELFTRLVEARHEWKKHPVYPNYMFEKYDALTLEIIKFRLAVGDCESDQEGDPRPEDENSWISGSAYLYNVLAGGMDSDEDEPWEDDEEQEEKRSEEKKQAEEEEKQEEKQEEKKEAEQDDELGSDSMETDE